jgi:alkylation response protein AidB-like acyl-CoA dehydrogenase
MTSNPVDVDTEIVAVTWAIVSRPSGRTPDVLGELGPLGLLGLAIPESAGGSGGTFALAGLVNEAAGRALTHGCVLHQQVAAFALAAASASPAAVQTVLSGAPAVLAVFPSLAVDAVQEEPGAVQWVPFGVVGADVVEVRDGELRWLPGQSVRCDLVERGWLIPLGRDARIETTNERVQVTAVDSAQVRTFAQAMTSMYMLGAARELIEQTTAYVKTRTQFGVAVGSFQAVKHRLADAEIQLSHADALARAALAALDQRSPTAATLVATAKHRSGDAALFSAEQCLQVTGGVGFTWESNVHLHLKAITRLRQWPNAAVVLRAELGRAILADPAVLEETGDQL